MFNDSVTFTFPVRSGSGARRGHFGASSDKMIAAQKTYYGDLQAILSTQSVHGAMPSENGGASGPIFESLYSPFTNTTRQQYNDGLPSGFVDMHQAPSFMELPQPLIGHGHSGDGLAALPSNSFELNRLAQLLQLPPLAYPQGQPNASQLPFFSGLTGGDQTDNLFLSGSSRGPSDLPSCAGPSSAPWSSGFSPQNPSPDPFFFTDNATVAIKQEEEDIQLSSPSRDGTKRSAVRRIRSDPVTSSGEHECLHHGCPWRFRSGRMRQRHERTHNAVNEYFCCNPACSTNTRKDRAGFSRRDSIRRHYTHKSSDDPCVIMARSLGWTGRLILEEEMFRVAPDSSSCSSS